MIDRVDLAGTPWRWIMLSESRDVACLVDAIDHDWLIRWKWNISWGSRTPWQLYAKRNVGPARSTLRMHREIMQHAEPRPADEAGRLVVDHGNGQTLDNRRANLSWLTGNENRAGQRRRELILSVEFVAARLVADWRAAAPIGAGAELLATF